jgi:hypothetical protein
MSTNLGVTDLTQAASAVSPAANNNDLVTLRKPRSFGYEVADLFHSPSNFMAWRHGQRERVVVFEIPIHELSVRAAHASRRDFDQDLISGHVWYCDIFEYKWLIVTMHSCSAH